jgi:hypothetical protein
MSIVLVGSTSGSVTLQEPAVAGTTVLDLPATSGTVALTSQIASFDAGTRLIFAQTTAPTGWTKDTTNYNNHALRVVTGAASTGGSVDFTTAFASGLSAGATTLSTSEIPSHTHTVPIRSPGCYSQGYAVTGADNNGGTLNTGSAGGGGSHTHSIPSFAVKYLDVITATKN